MTIQWTASFVALGLMLLQTSQSQTEKWPPANPASSTVVRSSSAGGPPSSRQVQTRTESAGREVVTQATEVPGPDGKFRVTNETTTETVRSGADTVQTKRDVYANDLQGQRKLLQTTQADQQKLPDGTARTVETTFTPDPNGKLAVSSRQIEESRSLGPNLKQTDIAIYRPGANEPLRESERVQQTERRVSTDLVQNESTRSVRDANGRWQTTETRNKESRTLSPAERVDEETVRRVDVNGTLALSERTLTRQSTGSGREETVIETYSQNAPGTNRSSNSPLELNGRVRTTSTSSADGRQTIREVEARNQASTNAALRVVERTVETLRRVGPDRWEIERQTFALDANGRLVPVFTEKGEAAGK